MYYISQEALGPCAQDPCQNGARCLDTMTARGKRTYFCFCADGWTGVNCELKSKEFHVFYIIPVPDDKILDWSKLKQIADILKCVPNGN